MKYKRIVLSLILIMFSTTTFSQINYGIKGGSNYSSMKRNFPNIGGLFGDFKPKFGISVGGFVEYEFDDVFTLETGLIYNSYGYSFGLAKEPLTNDLTASRFMFGDGAEYANLQYLNIPLIGKYNFSNFALGAGPQIGYLIKNSNLILVKKKDLGVVLHGEYNSSNGISYSVRYLSGISNISYANKYNNDSSKNTALNFSIGYRFNN